MNILVIGAGGREHAISKKLLASPKVDTVYCAPGNPGMTKDGINCVAISERDHSALIHFVKKEAIDWSIVGPEVPLLNGIVDDFMAEGLKIFGPTKAAALIEGSKSFAKQLMDTYQIPTAKSRSFECYEKAAAYIKENGAPIVVKADGLAAGKGVVVATTVKEALDAAEQMLNQHRFGDSSKKIVVEEFLAGEEFSLLAFVRNTKVYPMVISQDHKRAFDNDKGPNTGGMGAYSPVPQISKKMIEKAVEEVLKPAALGMKELGRSFTGVLYAGLIATKEGPKVIEFNARFGDPETQVVLSRLKSDFAQVIDDLLENRTVELKWQQEGYNVGVVVAAAGYPEEYETGMVLPDFPEEELSVYYAGVSSNNGKLVGTGGRLYLVEAYGETIKEAQEKIYTALMDKTTDGTFYRTDIGEKAANSELVVK